MAYVVWVVAQCNDQLLLCFGGQVLLHLLSGSHAPCIQNRQQQRQKGQRQGQHTAASSVCLVEAFNSNLLALFLAANLLTGLVNFLVNTLAVGDALARVIIGEQWA
jgi:uncharacterized membrane protein